MTEYKRPEWINRVPKEYQEIFEKHDMWVKGVDGGKRANLRGVNLVGVNLIGANLFGASLYMACLEGANLQRANLKCASLDVANLMVANLGGANLIDANLMAANLGGVNLIDANLMAANLGGVNLRGANLRGANLRGAKNIVSFGPIGKKGRIGYAVKHENCIMVKLGCFWGTEEKAINAIEEKYGKDSAYAGLVSAACRALNI